MSITNALAPDESDCGNAKPFNSSARAQHTPNVFTLHHSLQGGLRRSDTDNLFEAPDFRQIIERMNGARASAFSGCVILAPPKLRRHVSWVHGRTLASKDDMFNLFAPRGFISFGASGYLSLIAGGEPIMISQLDYESGTDRLRFWGGIAAGYPFFALFSERVRLIAEKEQLTQDFPMRPNDFSSHCDSNVASALRSFHLRLNAAFAPVATHLD